jgi:ubiquinol-cytochrome c reductase cytochrome c1 subunit
MKPLRIGLFIFLCVAAGQPLALAVELANVDIPHTPEAVRRGAQVISNVCMSCHSLKYVKYGGLSQLGFSSKDLDTLRNGKSLKEPLLTDMSPDMLRESFGTLPPDLSLMANAREGGAVYIYSLLTGFYQKADGSVDNHVFPGIKMPDVLNFSDAKEPAQRAPLEEQAKDAAAFLAWAADPHAAERHRLGYYVLIYLVVLTILLYLSKRRVWARLGKVA